MSSWVPFSLADSDLVIMVQYIPILMNIEMKWFGTEPNAFHRYTRHLKGPSRGSTIARGAGVGFRKVESCIENHGGLEIIKWHLQIYVQMFTSQLSNWGSRQSFKINFAINYSRSWCIWNKQRSTVSSDATLFSHLLLLLLSSTAAPHGEQNKTLLILLGLSAHVWTYIILHMGPSGNDRHTQTYTYRMVVR